MMNNTVPYPVLELDSVSKDFGNQRVVNKLNLALNVGKVHSLIGANGSGKSTTVKMISGVHLPNEGNIVLNGEIIKFNNPMDAKKQGIITVFQERQIFPDLSITENIFLDRLKTDKIGRINWKKSVREAEQLLASFGFNYDCKVPISHYNTSVHQMIEIIRGLIWNPKVLILDEPTASLSRNEVNILFDLIKKLKTKNVAILFIAHNIDDIIAISDEITILQDGKKIETIDNHKDISKDYLINTMLGIDNATSLDAKRKSQDHTIRMNVSKLKINMWNTDVSFAIRENEILSIAGLIGSGAPEVAQRLYGIQASKKPYYRDVTSIKDAKMKHISYLPPDRKSLGLFFNLNNRENITASIQQQISKNLIHSKELDYTIARQMIEETSINQKDPDFYTENLSGGNQQKVLFSRVLATNPKLMILENPTVGVDVKSQAEIHNLIIKKRNEGMSVLLVSTDYNEIAKLSDRILIFYEGKIIKEIENEHFTEHDILMLVGGIH